MTRRAGTEGRPVDKPARSNVIGEGPASRAWSKYMNGESRPQTKQKAGRPPEDEWPDSSKAKKLKKKRKAITAGGGGAW